MVKKKKDYLLFSLICQFFVCALLLGCVFVLKYTNSNRLELFEDSLHAFRGNDFEFLDYTKKITTDTSEPASDITECSSELNEKVIDKPETEAPTDVTELSVEIKGAGGNDYSVSSIDDIPENVSVNSYSLNQRMIMPVADGEITSEFGVRTHPITNELKFHAGIDIAADTGTPIYACFTGKVIVAEYDDWNGYYIKIQHEGDVMTVYCHCNKLNVNKGDLVEAGDVIGFVGSTGSSTGPHLHFEFRIGNVSYDPQKALNEAISAI